MLDGVRFYKVSMIYYHFELFSPPGLGRIKDFTEGGSILGPPKAVPCRRVRGHPQPEIFLSRLRKCDFRRFEARWWCFEVSFFKPKCHSLIFYNFFDVSGSNLEGSSESPEPPLYPPQLVHLTKRSLGKWHPGAREPAAQFSKYT